MIRIHHSKRARSARVIWLLEELGVPYELVHHEFTLEVLRSDAYRAIHPLGLIPAIEDGDVRMIESGAILQYLLEKHDAACAFQPRPGSPERPLYLQWFHYGEASLARHVGDVVRHRFTLPEAARIPAFVEEARARFREGLGVAERALEGRAFILGDAFTAADIMMAYGMVMGRITRELPAEFSNIAGYLDRLKQRPAYAKAWA